MKTQKKARNTNLRISSCWGNNDQDEQEVHDSQESDNHKTTRMRSLLVELTISRREKRVRMFCIVDAGLLISLNLSPTRIKERRNV